MIAKRNWNPRIGSVGSNMFEYQVLCISTDVMEALDEAEKMGLGGKGMVKCVRVVVAWIGLDCVGMIDRV